MSDKFAFIILVIYISYIQEEFLFYITQKFYCKKNKGNCNLCNNWSCPRKKYLEGS